MMPADPSHLRGGTVALFRMKPALPTPKIGVDALRIGMFIHLDLGWMSHPFPLGSFKLVSEDQIATIRSLGVKTVRWCPTQSDPAETDLPAPAPAVKPVVEAPVESPEAAARRQRREALAAQRAALALCEQQFGEATRECRLLTERVASNPQGARDAATALTQALIDKMAGQQELCIKLLTEGAGDKASAHAVNVTIVSLLMGRVFGFGAEDMQDLGVGSLLHDIGKLDLPERLRHREDHFSSAESRAYEEHVVHGVAWARKMGLSAGATMVVAQHHEHADGSGFPLRVNADRITAAARIVALVDRYDKLCNPNVTARALTPHESLSYLFAQGKNRFDTAILGAFIKMMGVYPPGSVVQLTDDRYALVVAVNSSRPLKPRVLVHEPKIRADEALTLDLERVPHLGIRRSVKPLALPRDALDYLSPRWRVAYFFEAAAAPLDPL
jgi:putative nucleotidyltransferase with HDIG domain